MAQSPVNIPCIHLSQIDSTNEYAKTALEDGRIAKEGIALVRADFQTRGKGQRGNYWESQEGKNLLLSLILHPRQIPAREQFVLSELIALSVLEVYEAFLGKDTCSVKWPNDIYHQDKKISGILIENTLLGSGIDTAIAGIGMNVNQTQFLSDAPNPTSPCLILGHEIDPEEVLEKFLEAFLRRERLLEEDYENQKWLLHEDFKSHLYRRQGLHRYKDKDGAFLARIQDVDIDGRLHLQDEAQQTRTYLFKEVQYVLA